MGLHVLYRYNIDFGILYCDIAIGVIYWLIVVNTRPGLQFSSETKCATLEIFHYASLTKPNWAESTVDDVTLPR